MGREEQIISERLKKIEELRKQGIDPYPRKFNKENSAADLQEEYAKLKNEKEGKKASTAGRLMSLRNMGKIAFGNIQDSTGKIQIVFQDGKTPKKVFDLLQLIDIGDFIGVSGTVFRTKRGELSILVKTFELLTKSIKPLPEKFHGLQDKEERYRRRYLDLIMNPEVKEVFEKRAKIIDVVRTILNEKKFLEVETPTLQSIYGGASSTPFTTHLNALDINLFLSISPELYLKRLVVGGIEKVFTICKNFRNEGIDFSHNPEFTMMEYYIAYEDLEFHMRFAEELFKRLKKELDIPEVLEYQGEKINLKLPFKRITFKDLIIKEIGVDIDKENSFEKLSKAINSKKINSVNIKGCSHYGALLDELYKRVVRPNIIQPTFLTHYPVEMIALAKRNKEDPTKINSVQLIINGAEIMKAYEELNDPIDQEKRLKEQSELLKKGDAEAMPMDEDFINALNIGLPPTAGYGMGIDRLVMLLTNQPSIRDVILFPFMKPE